MQLSLSEVLLLSSLTLALTLRTRSNLGMPLLRRVGLYMAPLRFGASTSSFVASIPIPHADLGNEVLPKFVRAATTSISLF